MVAEEANDLEETPLQACYVLHRGPRAVAPSPRAQNAKSAAGRGKKRPAEDTPADGPGTSSSAELAVMPPCMEGEPAMWCELRAKAYSQCWASLHQKAQAVFSEFNEGTYVAVAKWVGRVHSEDQLALVEAAAAAAEVDWEAAEGTEELLSERPPPPLPSGSRQLNTGLLYTGGVNGADHAAVYEGLAQTLQDCQHQACHVAVLKPCHLASSLDAALRAMLRQFIRMDPETTDLEILAAWQQEQGSKGLSPQPLVILVEDAECCTATVLKDLILVLSEWRAELPLVLLLGLATGPSALRRLLPAGATARLRTHCFALKRPIPRMEAVLRQVVVEGELGFGLGHAVVEFLHKFFLDHHLTAASLLRALQVACIEHFGKQPLSFLCWEAQRAATQEDFVASMEALLERPALERAGGVALQGGGRTGGGRPDPGLKQRLLAAIWQAKESRHLFAALLKCVEEAARAAGMPARASLPELHRHAHHPAFLHSQSSGGGSPSHPGEGGGGGAGAGHSLLLAIGRRLKDLKADALGALMQTWEEHLAAHPEVCERVRAARLEVVASSSSTPPLEQGVARPPPSAPPLKMGAAKAARLVNASPTKPQEVAPQTRAQAAGKEKGASTGEPPGEAAGGSRGGGARSAGARVQRGQSAALKRRQALVGAFGQTKEPVPSKEHVGGLLQALVKQYLVPAESQPFQAVHCFTDVAALQQALAASPAGRLQQDLADAAAVLGCSCCAGQALTPAMHDTCIAYRLMVEAGETVSIAEWYLSFADILNPPQSGGLQTGKGKKAASVSADAEDAAERKAELQARFSRASTELQVLGLVRPAKRRPDYVQRLLFT